MKAFGISLIFFFLGLVRTNVMGQSAVEKAYQHLYKIMDKYHTTFDVYTDSDAGGNRFYPTLIGNYRAVEISENYYDDSTFDATSIKISYPTIPVGEKDWAAVQWMFPDTNWGYSPGQDLRGARKLTFLARGEHGGEKVEFKLGGVNRPPHHVPSRPFMDSADILSTGLVTLSTQWQEYSIDLAKTDSFAVYLDGNAGSNNRYVPSGWMNGSGNMQVDLNWKVKPHSGSSCIKVDWNGMSGADGSKWNAVMWQYPEGNWDASDGYDLTGATRLTFYAKTDEPGLKLQFQVGSNYDSCGEVFIAGRWVEIGTEWRRYTIDLPPNRLGNVRGGFAFAFNNTNDPNPDGTVFYLDDMVFDKPVSKDLSNVIAGSICAVSKSDNPQGCTFYLDNIRYQLSDQRRAQRLREPHLLESYVTKNDTFDIVLRNTAFLYDNGLVLLAFLQRGNEEDLWRADVLAHTMVFCQKNDRDFQGRFQDFRLRNAYRSGDLIEPHEGWARLPFYYDQNARIVREDPTNLGSLTGNLAWVMIALTHHYEQRHSSSSSHADSSLNAAIRLGRWILNNAYANDSKQGYFGGVENIGGMGYVRVPWKSTEHNLDMIAAFYKLFNVTKDSTWYHAAERAVRFVKAMYHQSGPYFWIGTTDSTQINHWPLVEDVQTWGLMVLHEAHYFPIIEWVRQNCAVTSDGFEGIDFDTDRDGVWFEGTAHAALTYWMAGDSQGYSRLIEQLHKAQDQAQNTDTLGIVAASHDGVTTGLNWKYYSRLHIGATAWYIFAETKWNPYWQIYEESPMSAVEENRSNQPPLTLTLYQNFPNPFNPSTQLRFSLPRPEHVSLRIYSTTGQLVRTLFDKQLHGGEHGVIWDGKADDGKVVASGVYVATLRAGEWMVNRKLVLIR